MATKKKKKKKAVWLLTLSVVFLALLGGFLYLQEYNKRIEDENKQNETQAVEILPVSLDSESIIRIDVTSKEYTDRYARSFIYDENEAKWICASESDIPLKQYTVKGLLGNATQITAVRVVSDDVAKDGSEYGLAQPEHTVLLTDKDGNQTELYLGSKALTGSIYYFSVKGDPKVYQIGETLYNYVKKGFYDFVDAPRYPTFTISQVVSVDYKNDDTEFTACYLPKDLSLVDAMSISTWYFPTEQPGRYVSAGHEPGNEFSSALTEFSFASCLNYKPTEEDMKEYGLDHPTQITVKYIESESQDSETDETGAEPVEVEKEFTILLGDKLEENGNPYFYACMNGIVYKANGKSGASFLKETYTMDYMFNYWPCQFSISVVDSFTVNYNGATLSCDVTVENTIDENGTEQEKHYYSIDGTVVSEEEGMTLFTTLIMIKADRILAADKSKPDAKVMLDYEFVTTEQDRLTRTIRIMEYDDNYYQLSINGDIRYLITRAEYKKITGVLDGYMQK